MPTLIELPNMRDGYVDVCETILTQGENVAPRGIETRELRDVIVTLVDPYDALPIGVGRKPNVKIAAAEALQLVGGFSSPKLMQNISANFGKFMDHGRFHGAYGRRVGTQLFSVVTKLRADPSTRQAVMTLWDPALDNRDGFHDYPCTLSLVFSIRNDALDMHVTMRSNDVYLGLAYDVFMFTQVQITVARCLEVAVGRYHHHAISLHLYYRDLEAIERLHHSDALDEPMHRVGAPFGFGSDDERTFTDAFNAARVVGHHRKREHAFRELTASEQWYANVLHDVL